MSNQYSVPSFFGHLLCMGKNSIVSGCKPHPGQLAHKTMWWLLGQTR